MLLEEQVTTPNCNLSETIHHSWHVVSREKNNDLFEVIMDDLAQVITEMSRYSNFLDSSKSQNKGPDHMEML